jgi:hypothetical protein
MGINGSYLMWTLPLGGWNINGKLARKEAIWRVREECAFRAALGRFY